MNEGIALFLKRDVKEKNEKLTSFLIKWNKQLKRGIHHKGEFLSHFISKYHINR